MRESCVARRLTAGVRSRDNIMVTIVPNFDWYAAKSKAAGLPPRCPIAQAELCPRYYSSLWLLADARITTQISDDDTKRLDRKWEPFRPTIREEEPSIVHMNDEFRGFRGFCPEVSYEIFGSFVSALHRYADEIDRDLMHKHLAREGASLSDPRWGWSTATPRHYAECREFSIFSKADLGFGARTRSGRRPLRQGLSARLRWQVLARDSFTC